jgi:CBS domain-containing protein
MLIREVMSKNIQTVDAEGSIKQAAVLMRDMDVGMLPVQEGDRLVGTVTDRDITVRATANGRDPDGTTVQEVMTQGVVSAYEDADTGSAVETMEQKKVRRLLVLDRQDKCVGIVSLADIALRTGDPALSEELLEEVSKPAA